MSETMMTFESFQAATQELRKRRSTVSKIEFDGTRWREEEIQALCSALFNKKTVNEIIVADSEAVLLLCRDHNFLNLVKNARHINSLTLSLWAPHEEDVQILNYFMNMINKLQFLHSLDLMDTRGLEGINLLENFLGFQGQASLSHLSLDAWTPIQKPPNACRLLWSSNLVSLYLGKSFQQVAGLPQRMLLKGIETIETLKRVELDFLVLDSDLIFTPNLPLERLSLGCTSEALLFLGNNIWKNIHLCSLPKASTLDGRHWAAVLYKGGLWPSRTATRVIRKELRLSRSRVVSKFWRKCVETR